MFDRESFKREFDMTDEEVDRFLEVCAGRKIDKSNENTYEMTDDNDNENNDDTLTEEEREMIIERVENMDDEDLCSVEEFLDDF